MIEITINFIIISCFYITHCSLYWRSFPSSWQVFPTVLWTAVDVTTWSVFLVTLLAAFSSLLPFPSVPVSVGAAILLLLPILQGAWYSWYSSYSEAKAAWLCSHFGLLLFFFLWIPTCIIRRSAPMVWPYGVQFVLHSSSACWVDSVSIHTLVFPQLSTESSLPRPDCSVSLGSSFPPCRTVLLQLHGVVQGSPPLTPPDCFGEPN